MKDQLIIDLDGMRSSKLYVSEEKTLNRYRDVKDYYFRDQTIVLQAEKFLSNKGHVLIDLQLSYDAKQNIFVVENKVIEVTYSCRNLLGQLSFYILYDKENIYNLCKLSQNEEQDFEYRKLIDSIDIDFFEVTKNMLEQINRQLQSNLEIKIFIYKFIIQKLKCAKDYRQKITNELLELNNYIEKIESDENICSERNPSITLL